MRAVENELAVADLKFLLPMQPGDHVWLGGNYPRLVEELEKLQMHVTLYDPEKHNSNLGNHVRPFEHAIFPVMPFAEIESNFELWSACLMDGASLVFGSSNPTYWLRFVKPPNSGNAIGLDPQIGKYVAGKFGFAVEQVYGNPADAGAPRYLVELGHRLPSWFFFKELFTPYRRGSEWVRQLSLGWSKFNSSASLYRSLVWHARYHPKAGGGDVG